MIGLDGKAVCPEARVETTNFCNAHCSICPRDKMTRPKTHMEMGLYIRLLDQLRNLGVTKLSLFGFGEPLMDPSIVDRIRYAKTQDFEVYLTTNGSLLSLARTREFIDAGLNHLRISSHGISKNSYEAVHRGLDWFDVDHRISTVIHANEMEGHRMTIHLTSIPMNGEDPEEIALYWLNRGVDFVEVWKPHGWAGAKDYRPLNLKKVTCGRPFSGPIQIQADGMVIPCCFLTNAEIVLGDANMYSLHEILTDGIQMVGLKQAHSDGSFGDLACATCDQRNEGDEPLLYSNRDEEKHIGRLSTSKFELLQ